MELAAQYYELRRPTLGGRFIDAVESALGRIIEAPETWPEVEPGLRRRLVRDFPYGVFFRTGADFIRIVAIAHLARKPGYWETRR